MLSAWLRSSRRPYLLAVLSLLSFCLLFVLSPTSWFWRTVSSRTRGFHFLIPATSVGPNLCRLLASGSINGYPDPVLLGWEDESTSHLLKISSTIKYLKSLPKDADDDLILMVDGFDVWMQLPPSVIIQRYHKALEKTNSRLKMQSIHNRARSAVDEPVLNTIIGTAEPFPWPRNGPKPAWHTCPESTFPNTTLGPLTDIPMAGQGTILPRYLNSGSIMGPVKDIRHLFTAVAAKIETEYDEQFQFTNSDQYFLSMVWHEQEMARNELRQRHDPRHMNSKDAPRQWSTTNDADDKRVEYHFSIDYESDAFQVNLDWSEHVTFMTHNRSQSIHNGRNSARKAYQPGRLDTLTLPDELIRLPGPFSAATSEDNLPTHLTWKDVMLGANLITGQVFPLYHVIFDKTYLNRWWDRLWWHPYGERLMQVARRQRLERTTVGGRYPVADVRGIRYEADKVRKADKIEEMRARDKDNKKGGSWAPTGEYLTWASMCGKHEAAVFVIPRL